MRKETLLGTAAQGFEMTTMWDQLNSCWEGTEGGTEGGSGIRGGFLGTASRNEEQRDFTFDGGQLC